MPEMTTMTTMITIKSFLLGIAFATTLAVLGDLLEVHILPASIASTAKTDDGNNITKTATTFSSVDFQPDNNDTAISAGADAVAAAAAPATPENLLIIPDVAALEPVPEAAAKPEPEQSFFCKPKYVRRKTIAATGRAPLVIWANARTGSTLLLDMLDGINSHTTEQELDLFTYGEFYNNAIKDLTLQHLEEDIRKSCKLPAGRWDAWYGKQAQYLYGIRQVNPMKLFYSLSDIPSWSKKPYYIMKMFNGHLTSMSEWHLIESLNKLVGIRKPKYLVLWRRRMIASHVSERVARATGQWQLKEGYKPQQPPKVILERSKLEQFTKKMRNYYSSVRDALHASNADYMVLEYERDLLDDSAHPQTLQKLIDFLEIDSSIDVQQIVSELHMKKQAQIPIEEEVENWQEVVEWGYGGGVDDWVDIFAD